MPVQQILRRIERHDSPLLQHRDAAAQRFGFLEVVRGEHDRVAVAVQPAYESPQRLPQLDVDAGGRLVEHDHRRLVHERLRDEHAPFHAARKRAHVRVGLAGEIEVLHHLVDPGGVIAHAVVTRLDRERFAHGEERIEHELLRHHPERLAGLPVLAHDVVTHHARSAGGGDRQTCDDADESRFAGAVRTEQSEKFAVRDVEAYARERLNGPKSFTTRSTWMACVAGMGITPDAPQRNPAGDAMRVLTARRGAPTLRRDRRDSSGSQAG